MLTNIENKLKFIELMDEMKDIERVILGKSGKMKYVLHRRKLIFNKIIMQNAIFSNKEYSENTIEKIKADGLNKLHVLADFDRTLTKAFSSGKIRPSLISVLRSEGYLTEEYSKKAYELFDYYHPIEIDPNVPMEEKKEQMTIWWSK